MPSPAAFDPMADIFVSYAKTDRSLASKLVAMLEAEGWKVWWDTSLAIGDDFRNEIMTELGRARAVIVIWTDASIKSDWVWSSVRCASARYAPLRFGRMSGCSRRHAFQAATPCLSNATCSSFAMETPPLDLPQPQSSSASRFTAGCFGFLLLTQCRERPER